MENLQTGVWLEIADPQIDKVHSSRLICKFENGQIVRYDEEYPFALLMKVLILPE